MILRLLLLLFLVAATEPRLAHAATGWDMRVTMQTDEVWSVDCAMEVPLASVGSVQVLSLRDPTAGPDSNPAGVVLSSGIAVCDEDLGTSHATESRCLRLRLKPACTAPAAADCRNGGVYQIHAQGVATDPAIDPDQVDCDVRLDVKDVRWSL